MRVELAKARALRGEITVPADKSLSHRAIMFTSLARGTSVVRNFLRAADTLSTMGAMKALGVDIKDGIEIAVKGAGLHGLREPLAPIDCGNSGTTMRLMSGILAGNPFMGVLTGDESLSRRPMARVLRPLAAMGATVLGREGGSYAPLAIKGGGLRAMRYEMPHASAQVKSAILLAGLYAEGRTEVIEKVRSRDHTERMLPAFGADMKVDGLTVSVNGGAELSAMDVDVPSDFSSAAFFMVAAALVPGSEVMIRRVGLNPTRTGLLGALRDMGAHIEVAPLADVSGEPVGDVLVRASRLKGISIGADRVPALIDEFPVLCVAASQAEGVTEIRGASELRVKESDRIATVAEGLRAMGVEVNEHEDGMSITGREGLSGASVESHGDHRIAMAFAVASLVADGSTSINGADAVGISFPGFFDTLNGMLT